MTFPLLRASALSTRPRRLIFRFLSFLAGSALLAGGSIQAQLPGLPQTIAVHPAVREAVVPAAEPSLADAPSAVLARLASENLTSPSLESSSESPSAAPQFSVGQLPATPVQTRPEHPAPAGFPKYPTPPQQHLREEIERNTDCENHVIKGKPCRVSWPRVLGESLMFLSAQHGGNIYMDKDTRYNLTHGSFWGDYVYCVDHYRWSRWKDDDPFGVDYIGHPMMGALTSAIYEQNDPKQRALAFENTKRYWNGRLRAMAYSAAYSAQWKIGPASEASIGNTGIGYYRRDSDGIITNETGMQDFFITPIGGLAWNVGEDAIDRFILSHIRHAHPKNKVLLFVASFATPTRSAANIARFRAPYYRDLDERTAGSIQWKPE